MIRLVERFSLEAKWLTVPRLLGLPGFDMGKEPHQGFAKLVRFRNGLIHYKPRAEVWEASGIPEFLGDLGLTTDAAECSLKAATAMIVHLAKQFGEKKPFWLSREDISYFEIAAS